MTAHVQAVILGGDIGAYAIARELHDACGIRPLMVSAYNPAAIRDSSILTLHQFSRASEEGPLVDELLNIGARMHRDDPEGKLMLLANTDWRIHVLAAHRAELEQWYTLPIPGLDVIEQVSDKAQFARLAEEQGLSVPHTFYQDFADAGSPGWQPEAIPETLRFPVVAKPADSATYENLQFPGRQKVYEIEHAGQLRRLWSTLAHAGFRGTFLAQELIAGDDTQMYSITAYVDRTGTVSLMCSARVLLEEHHPATLGNPCAMVTETVPEILEPARRFLESLPYRGFANFDVKRDPTSGAYYFLEVNPRIGRNSFYVQSAGINPMTVLVDDVLETSVAGASRTAGETALYSIIPQHLLLRYINDPALRQRVQQLKRQGRRFNPLRNPKDAGLRRWYYRVAQELNQYIKFHRYYPRPTATGFSGD